MSKFLDFGDKLIKKESIVLIKYQGSCDLNILKEKINKAKIELTNMPYKITTIMYHSHELAIDKNTKHTDFPSILNMIKHEIIIVLSDGYSQVLKLTETEFNNLKKNINI